MPPEAKTPIFYRRGIRNFWRLPLPVRRVLIVPVAVFVAVVTAAVAAYEGLLYGLSLAEHSMRSERVLAEMRGAALSPGDRDAS